MDLTNFPNDLFLLITSYLEPEDCIRCRAVSRKWRLAFTGPDLSRLVLQRHYPRAREVRSAWNDRSIDWSNLLMKVASRYHHLKAGKPRNIERLPLAKSFMLPAWCRVYGVSKWQRFLQFEEKTAPFEYPDSLWTYDDGLLIFPSSQLSTYALCDLNTGRLQPIEIHSVGKIVRRIRLKGRLLVVEWCEQDSYHQLNENEEVSRHFATAYDLIAIDSVLGNWRARFRNEWKIHFLGLPLNSRDRFFSSFTSTHYTMYLWQPNRSAWGEDDPIEALAVWDISSPSEYRPSEDSTGSMKPNEDSEGARVIRRLSFADLDFYKIRQRSTPTLRGLDLDENHVYIIEEDHRWLVGQQAGHNLPRLHKVKSTGIPFAAGPRWEDECGADGDVNLSFCERRSDEREPGFAPCWRHEEFPYLTITEAVDAEAGVRYCARHCFMLETISISVKPKVHMTGPGYEISLRDDLWQQLLGKGSICGDERWLIGENLDNEVVIFHFDEIVKKGIEKGSGEGADRVEKSERVAS